jgi:hypothetical protein
LSGLSWTKLGKRWTNSWFGKPLASDKALII